MKTIHEADIQPLDLILFRGVDPISHAIQFMEFRKIGRGDYSHAGMAVTREVLDLPFLEPGRVYVWESVLSAKEGFMARFTDHIPSAETAGVVFGVQLRDLEQVIPGYVGVGGRVSWCPFVGERPPPGALAETLMALHEEYGHASYTENPLNLLGVVFPAIRGAADRMDHFQDRVAEIGNRLLRHTRRQQRLKGAKQHVFCSEWVARIYDRLGILHMPDPRLAAPVHFLTRTQLFAPPTPLVPEGFDPRSFGPPGLHEVGAEMKGGEARQRAIQATFLRHHALQEKLRSYAESRVAGVTVTPDDRFEISFRGGDADAEREAESWVAEEADLRPRRARAPLALGTEPLPLQIAILVVGTRGDVEPFIPIGRRLQRDGHRVRLATHARFRDFVESSGLEFHPLGGDPQEPSAHTIRAGGKEIPTKSDPAVDDVSGKRKRMEDLLQSTWRACTEKDPERADLPPFRADAILSNPPTLGHVHVAEALRVPLHMVFTMPWSPTRWYPHAMANLSFDGGPRLENRLSYGVLDTLLWAGAADPVAKFRKQLGIPALGLGAGPGLLHDGAVPFTYLWSPSLVERPEDWGHHIDVADFVFSDLEEDYEPPADLTAFLEAGDPPVYVGFGSIPVEDPAALARTIFDALAAAGKRGIVSIDRAALGDAAPPEHVYPIGDGPHDWLFPRCAAVCHPGSAEMTATGLRAGRPTVVVPVSGDQPFWGARVARTGAGPAPIPIRELDAPRLAAAFRACDSPAVAARAAELGRSLESRDGGALAVQAFYRHLPTTVDGILSFVGFDAPQRERLRAGQVVAQSLNTPMEESFGFLIAAQIDRPLPEILADLREGRPLEVDPRVEVFGALGDRDAGPQDLVAAGFRPDEAEAAEALMRSTPDGPFNLSSAERTRFQSLAARFPEPGGGPERIAEVNETLREILLERHRAYRSQGLAGIAPYERSDGQVTRPDELLRVAFPPDSLVSEELPDLYRTLLTYPEGAEDLEHHFYWKKEGISGDPIFSLAHHVLLPGEELALLVARTFYASRDLDARQIIVGLLHQGEGTLVVASHRAADPQLAGFLRQGQRDRLREHLVGDSTHIIEALRAPRAS